ncbi:hypothetical protein C8Q80DRAFT_1141239 [Daedaleopsis nitida]|nr:hypothetical protein C8Q80DRAFT_1141239 [Daedaleopsis nitida]
MTLYSTLLLLLLATAMLDIVLLPRGYVDSDVDSNSESNPRMGGMAVVDDDSDDGPVTLPYSFDRSRLHPDSPDRSIPKLGWTRGKRRNTCAPSLVPSRTGVSQRGNGNEKEPLLTVW